MRLIDADVAHSLVKQYEASDEFWTCTGGTAIRLIHNAIDNVPTVDAVPVVQLETDSVPVSHVVTVVLCRDCKYSDHNNKNEMYCYHCFGLEYIEPDDFCSYGERRGGSDDNVSD